MKRELEEVLGDSINAFREGARRVIEKYGFTAYFVMVSKNGDQVENVVKLGSSAPRGEDRRTTPESLPVKRQQQLETEKASASRTEVIRARVSGCRRCRGRACSCRPENGGGGGGGNLTPPTSDTDRRKRQRDYPNPTGYGEPPKIVPKKGAYNGLDLVAADVQQNVQNPVRRRLVFPYTFQPPIGLDGIEGDDIEDYDSSE